MTALYKAANTEIEAVYVCILAPYIDRFDILHNMLRTEHVLCVNV